MPPYSDNSQWSDASPNSSPNASPISPNSRPRKHPKHNPPLNHHQDVLQIAASELESMRQAAQKALDESNSVGSAGSCGSVGDGSRSFPPACLTLLQSLTGNNRCIDCNEVDATWASVTYGCVMCLKCSGRHRGLGVKRSFVKSLTLDSWNHVQVLSMLEGGNAQLSQFFTNHKMGNSDCNSNSTALSTLDRYNTKAAVFYKEHLISHARDVGDFDKSGLYQGREVSRVKALQQRKSKSSKRVSKRDKLGTPTTQLLCKVEE